MRQKTVESLLDATQSFAFSDEIYGITDEIYGITDEDVWEYSEEVDVCQNLDFGTANGSDAISRAGRARTPPE